MKVLIHILILKTMLTSSEVICMPLGLNTTSYEKIVACEGYDRIAIYSEIVEYFNGEGVLFEKDSATLMISENTLRIYSQVISAIKNPVGEVTFDVKVDVKDEKFRLTISNLWFRALERDRYGKLVMSQDDPSRVTADNFKHRRSLFRKIENQVQTYLNEAGKEIRDKIMNDELNITNW